MTIKFKRLSETDIEARTCTLNERAVLEGILTEVPVSLAESQRWFERIKGDYSRRDFALLEHGAPIGFSGIVNINNKDRVGEIYIFISPRKIGEGIGSRLLKMTILFAKMELNLRKLILYVTESNDSVIKFYEKNGFGREAVLKNHVWHRGGYHDRFIYSLFLNDADLNKDILYDQLS